MNININNAHQRYRNLLPFQVGQNTGVTMIRTVTLQHPGCLYEAIIMHELLHTLGK